MQEVATHINEMKRENEKALYIQVLKAMPLRKFIVRPAKAVVTMDSSVLCMYMYVNL